jgi:hypothetical protein
VERKVIVVGSWKLEDCDCNLDGGCATCLFKWHVTTDTGERQIY